MLAGNIKRRFLLNFRVDPDVLKKILPAPFSPKAQVGGRQVVVGNRVANALDDTADFAAAEFLGLELEAVDLFHYLGVGLGHDFLIEKSSPWQMVATRLQPSTWRLPSIESRGATRAALSRRIGNL